MLLFFADCVCVCLVFDDCTELFVIVFVVQLLFFWFDLPDMIPGCCSSGLI